MGLDYLSDQTASFDNTDQAQDSTSLFDVLTGAASSAASGVITAAGDRLGSVITGGPPAAAAQAPISAINKAQPGTAVVATAGVGSLLALGVGAWFLLRK